ncbi:MAG: hypothetical protein J6K61_03530 [Clostridia bacterium]|nr:hypothetical protein [Clostridia bacterium]
MKKKNKKLTPKQVKALARQTRNANAQKAKQGPVAAEKTRIPLSPEKFWLYAALAVVIALAVVVITLCGIALHRTLTAPKYPSLLDTVDLEDYLVAHRVNYTGHTVKLTNTSAYTDEDFEADKKTVIFNNRKLLAGSQRDVTLGTGDTVYFYIIGAKDAEGNPIAKDAFAAYNYTSYLSVTLGADHVFGETLDAALSGLNPATLGTVRNVVTSGDITEDSVVGLTYEMYVSSGKNAAGEYTWKTSATKKLNGGRVNLSDLDAAFREALLNAYTEKTMGEKVSFVLENYYDHDGKEATAPLTVRVDACVNMRITEESVTEITFTPPKDCFSSQGYASLCKDLYDKEITFTVILQWADDYEMPTFNGTFIKETLGFETDKTTDEEIIAAYRAKLAENKKEQYRQNCIAATYGQILDSLSGNFKDLPQSLYEEKYNDYVNELQIQFQLYGSSFTDINQFAQYYSYYNVGQQVSSASEYCGMMAEMQAMKEVLMYTIFYKEGMKVTEQALLEARAKCLADMVERAGDPEVYSETYFVNLYTEDYIMQKARREYAIPALVDAFLLENNTIQDAN